MKKVYYFSFDDIEDRDGSFTVNILFNNSKFPKLSDRENIQNSLVFFQLKGFKSFILFFCIVYFEDLQSSVITGILFNILVGNDETGAILFF